MFKIIFAGTAEFAAPSLQNLLKNKNCQVHAVITRPDRPAGRGLTVQESPIKKFVCRGRPACLPDNIHRGETACSPDNMSPDNQGRHKGRHIGLPVRIRMMQPQKIIEIKEQIKKLSPDLLIVCAYGEILPTEILAIPRLGAINLHASILPKYRGASPIQAAILNGNKYSGVSIIQMDEKLDHGSILGQARLEIAADETGGSLHDKLAEIGARLLEFTLEKIVQSSKFKVQSSKSKFKNFKFYDPPMIQNEKQASYTKKLNRRNGLIQPRIESAVKIERKVRAYDPWPGNYLEIKNLKLKIKNCNLKFKIRKFQKQIEILKIYQVNIALNNKNAVDRVLVFKKIKLGELFVFNNQLMLKCRLGCLILQKVQIPGKKIISGEDFARGYLQLS